MSLHFGRVLTALTLGSFLLTPAPGHAITVVLDGAAGADYDSVGDGWFFAGSTPPLPAPDGVGDAGGQPLAVGIKAGVLELRAMSEFPLASLAGFTAGEITSATLTVTIDDVIGTFGPGAEFDGTASSPIAAYSYPADGTVNVADFSPAGLSPLGTITPGVITDATLGTTGPVSFDVDVTAAVQAFLGGGQTHFGLLLGTLDSPTATSLDNLSPPAPGPGGQFPFITIEITPEVPPTYSAEELKCQAGIAKSSAGLAAAQQKNFAKCLDTILKTVAASDPVSEAQETCTKGLDETNAKSGIAKAKAKTAAAITKACEGLVPADVDSPCDAGATTFADTATCIVDATESAVEEMIQDRYAKGCVLLEAVGLADDFPGVCN
jgi:hypothetical protein